MRDPFGTEQGTHTFTDKKGQPLELWQVPLKSYLETKPPMQHKRWRAVHALSVVDALDSGKSVPGKVLAAYPEEELCEAREKLRRVRAMAAADAEEESRERAAR